MHQLPKDKQVALEALRALSELDEELGRYDEKGISQASTGGLKHSGAKLPYHLITPEMESALAEGLQLGINKGYPARNWEKGLALDECHVAAARRHINKWRSGEDLNQETHMETGEPVQDVHHLICAFVNLGMAITQIKRNREDLDDRSEYCG